MTTTELGTAGMQAHREAAAEVSRLQIHIARLSAENGRLTDGQQVTIDQAVTSRLKRVHAKHQAREDQLQRVIELQEQTISALQAQLDERN